jgi:hypothetical protein
LRALRRRQHDEVVAPDVTEHIVRTANLLDDFVPQTRQCQQHGIATRQAVVVVIGLEVVEVGKNEGERPFGRHAFGHFRFQQHRARQPGERVAQSGSTHGLAVDVVEQREYRHQAVICTTYRDHQWIVARIMRSCGGALRRLIGRDGVIHDQRLHIGNTGNRLMAVKGIAVALSKVVRVRCDSGFGSRPSNRRAPGRESAPASGRTA